MKTNYFIREMRAGSKSLLVISLRLTEQDLRQLYEHQQNEFRREPTAAKEKIGQPQSESEWS
jgi:aconitase B